MTLPALMISAAHKSSGKTTLTLGLAAAFAARGVAVQTFKKGPDYIDPMWLALASGRPCFNLDAYLMGEAAVPASFARHAAGADLALVEGNKGLYDGLALDGSNSNAALAHQLGLPVVLVIDARGMTRGVAPLILGYQAFDRQIRIAGVILNRLGGSRHEAKLRAVIEHYTDVPVLGAVQHDERLAVTERHLGLVPACELADATRQVGALAAAVEAQVDLDRLQAVAGQALPVADGAEPLRRVAEPRPSAGGRRLRIGIARDRAFGFYYADDLFALEAAGAQLIPIDTLADTHLPALDGLFIGGGFPEVHMAALSANAALRQALREAIAAGLPTYAECGGLMYLSRTLRWNDRLLPMVGAIPGDVVMHERPVGRGYVHLQATGDFPWPGDGAPAAVRAHEFHHSSLDNLGPETRFAYRVRRGHGIDGRHDGVVVGHLLASYAHRHSAGVDGWAPRFMAFVQRQRAERDRAACAARAPQREALTV